MRQQRGETEGLFAPDAFSDLTFPHWRLQAKGADEMNGLKNQMHPPGGTEASAIHCTPGESISSRRVWAIASMSSG